jgi:hypothetical protein
MKIILNLQKVKNTYNLFTALDLNTLQAITTKSILFSTHYFTVHFVNGSLCDLPLWLHEAGGMAISFQVEISCKIRVTLSQRPLYDIKTYQNQFLAPPSEVSHNKAFNYPK